MQYKNLCGLSERFLRNMEAIRWGERLLQSWQTEGKTADHAKIVEDYDPDIFVGNEMEVVSVDVCGNKDLGFLPGR